MTLPTHPPPPLFYHVLLKLELASRAKQDVLWGPEINFSEFFAESWFSRKWIKAKFQTQGLSITLYKLTYNWLAYNFNELRCQQKIQAFTAFLHSLVYWRKRRPWTKKGTHIQKKVPRRTQISWRGPIWEQCKRWKPFLGVYLQLSSLLSRLWSEGGTGQDGGAGPKFLQGKTCHCFVNLLWFSFNFFATGS